MTQLTTRKRSWFNSFFLWTWLAVALSAGICAGLAFLRYEQARILDRANGIIDNISKARMDLEKGFLHVTLAGAPNSPFSAGEGRALIDQAIESIRESGKEVLTGQNGPLQKVRSWGDFEKKAAEFRANLDAWFQGQGSLRQELELQLWISFGELEQYAAQIELASQTELDLLDEDLNRRYGVTILISGLLLSGICAAVFLTGRSQSAAVRALEKQEELLEEMGHLAKVGGWELDVATGAGQWTAEVARIHDLPLSTKPGRELGLSFYSEESRPRIEAALKETIERGVSYDLELEFTSAKGVRKWVRTIGNPVVEDGKVVRLRGSFQDITPLKQAETALRRRELQLRLFIEHSPAAIAMLDKEMRYLVVSRRWITDFGLKETDVIGRCHYDVFPEVPERWKEVHRRCLAGAVEKSDGDSFERQDGSIDWLRWETVPWRDEKGEICGLILFSEVITQQKLAKEAVRRKQQNYEAMFNATNDGIFVRDAGSGQLLDVNESAVRMYGYESKAEFLAIAETRFMASDSPYDAEEARRRGRMAVEQGPQLFEWMGRRKDGSDFWVEASLTVSQIDGRPCVLSLIRDISERKRHEMEISRLNRLYSTLSQVNQVIVRCVSRPELFQEICRVMIQFGKMQRAVVLCMDAKTGALTTAAYKSVWPEEGATSENPGEFCDSFARAIQADRPIFCHRPASNAICSILMARPEVQSCGMLPIRVRGKVCGALNIACGEADFFKAEEVRLLEEIAEDISFALGRLDEQEQKLVAEAERARLSAAMEQAAESVIITDVHANIVYVNPAFERISGYTQAEVLGQNPRLLKSNRHGPGFYSGLWETLCRGEAWQGRITNRRKDGGIFQEDAAISPIRDSTGRIVNFVAVKRDITREVELEARFLQAQKMEGLGQLAGGVAHDFNNILAAIMMQSQMTGSAPGIPPGVAEEMEDIRRECERGSNLTRQLLLFSRKQIMQRRHVDLNSVISNLARMLRRIIGENISIELKLCARPLPVHADSGMLGQVLVNLAVNARDAMGSRGTLTIATGEKTVDETEAKACPEAKPGRYACLSVSDNGCGIPPEVLPRIFEPFFTTKEQGKGTGLGLATVFGIVKEHEGWLDIATEVGKGTTFEIYIPASVQISTSLEDIETVPRPKPGTETILLAEDDFSVRKVTARLLESNGYKVLEAANGVEALALWQKHGTMVDLLLTDVLMPEGLNGRDLAKKLLADKPDLKVVFVSGYSADLFGPEGGLRPGENFLQKPCAADDLLNLVCRQLGI